MQIQFQYSEWQRGLHVLDYFAITIIINGTAFWLFLALWLAPAHNFEFFQMICIGY